LYAERGFEELKPLLARSHVVFMNEAELKQVTGLSYRRGAKFLNETGVEISVITRGSKGCFIKTPGKEISVACNSCKPVDTTGAGDSFAAGFLAGLLKNKSLKECGRLGNQLAGRCIKQKGARSVLK
jgi:ribokinase